MFSQESMSDLLSQIIAWYRYIDDVFILWSGSREDLSRLMDLLTVNTFNLSFTMECSQIKINFLDLQIHLDCDGTLHSSLYRKPSSGNTILHAASAHPQPLLDSIPYSQFVRLRRNCTLDSDFHQAANDLYERLRRRGYSCSLLRRSFNRVIKRNRHDLIHSTKSSKINNSVRIITQFSKQHGQMRGIFQKYWPLLMADNTIKKFLKSYPEITYRRAPSMRDMLVHSHHEIRGPLDYSNAGTFSCSTCDFCPFIFNSKNIPLPNGRIHRLKHRVTCKTIGVVYLALCQCGCFYVGKTKRPFLKRIKDHIAPLYKHLTTTALKACGHRA